MPIRKTETAFGYFMRNLRAKHNENQKECAKRIIYKDSWLSRIETGARPVPKGIYDRIAKAYSLNESETAGLKNSILMSLQTLIN